jgi:hypothetical protein
MWLLGLAASGLMFVPQLISGQGGDLSGTWVGKAVLDDGSVDGVTLVLKKDKEVYSGTIVDEQGIVPADTEITDVTITGKELKFSFMIPNQGGTLQIKIILTVEGDTMKGGWEDVQGGTGGSVEVSLKK